MKLTEEEAVQVAHWRRWVENGGTKLNYAPMAIEPLLDIIDRLTQGGNDD